MDGDVGECQEETGEKGEFKAGEEHAERSDQ